MTPRTFKALGVLVLYPGDDVVEALADIEAIVDGEGALSPSTRVGVGALARSLRTRNRLDLEEEFVNLFDRDRAVSLHLFEHTYGDARERGAAMVALRELYERHGLVATNGELPDYVPVLCEFLSEVPADVGRQVLSDAAPVLRLLHRRLGERGSGYAAVFAALLELAGETVETVPCAVPLPLDWDEELARLDAERQEEPVPLGAAEQGAPIQTGCAVSRRA
ncbi:nitrate reductase molybdenum cofactor assembly chaperone [Candidatus Binatia bacterium]|nr:nitrate reductase molybdenum cofactor assembly chaperone [Candidatus Binatia bacterium]